jgi:hypothetical protein
MMARFAGAALGLALILSAACQPPPPEQALRDRIGRMVTAIRDRDAGAVMDNLSQGFEAQGGLQRRDAYRFMLAHFLRHDGVYVVLSNMEIDIHRDDPGRARVAATAALAGTGGTASGEAGIYRIESRWRMIDGRWRLHRLRWQ